MQAKALTKKDVLTTRDNNMYYVPMPSCDVG